MRVLDAKVELADLAGRQFGIVTRRQLMDSGVTRTRVSRWLRDGRLHRLHPGVYAVGHDALGIEARLTAALFHAAPGAMLSHTTAGWWQRLQETPPTVIHVSTPRRRRSDRGVVVHDRRSLTRVMHRGLPVTSPVQTLLDLAATASASDLRRALAEAEYQRLVDTDTLMGACRSGIPGSAALRAAVNQHQPALARTRSVLEERFVALCERHGVPVPEMNARVRGMIVDALWEERRFVVELDGHAGHSSPAATNRDRRRELRLRAAGFLVARYTWDQVTRDEDSVAADVIACLRGPGRPV